MRQGCVRSAFRFFFLGLFLCSSSSLRAQAPVAGQNVNMVSGTQWPGGDPFLQRQNEPSLAVSSRNLLHLLAGANDYRTVDLPTEPGSVPGTLSGDAWLGVFKSFDGGQRWQSTLLPGYPQDQSALGLASPLKAYSAAADPTVRAGTNGLFYFSGIAFNRGTNLGGVFVTTFLDANQKENGDATQGLDTIRYLSTVVVDTGTSGQFLDKPWIAVDIPRSGAGTCTFNPFGTAQSFKAGNVYIVWSRFTGSQSTKIMFSRSQDCGKTWSSPIKLSESNSINQGTNLAIDPATGAIYAAWRRFATSSQGDAIIVAKSTDFGKTFPSRNTVEVASIVPFDQGTTATEIRTNALPSIAASVDSSNVSRVHVAWAQRNATTQDAQIVVATSTNGASWSAPVPVDTVPLTDDAGNMFARGHQFMPQVTFSAGRLMVLYYDQRLDHTLGFHIPNDPFAPDALGRFYLVRRDKKGELAPPISNPNQVFTLNIDDATLTVRRHTVDLRVAEALPGSAMAFSSSTVSQYRFGLRALDDFGNPIVAPAGLDQLQSNPPNLPLFAQGTVPFLGDYIDIAGQMFVASANGTWSFNTSRSNAPIFYASWTDNRDVRPPLDGDWTHYTPTGLVHQSVLDPTRTTPLCVNGQEGMRNQNIYSSRITEGLLVGSPQDAKPLSPTLKRVFVVTLQNLTSQARTFHITIASQPPGGSASFLPGSLVTALDVVIEARAGAARPVFATSSNPAATIAVNVTEAAGPGSLGLSGSVVLNPEGSVSPLVQPDGTTTDIGSLEIYTPSFQVWNPSNPNPFLNISNPNEALNISNLNISNLNISNADPAILNISNLNISNLNISNLNISNPDPAILNISNLNISNTTAANLNISNLNISNLNISNLNISNTPVTDTTYAVTNSGNTSHSYRVALFGNNPGNTPLQLIVSKNSTTPTSVGCTLQNVPQGVVVTTVGNAPVATSLADATNPNIVDSSASNATMALAPGETAFLTLRGALTPDQMAQLTRSLTPVVTAHGANTFAALLFIQTGGGILPAAVVGTPYSTTLQAAGGNSPLTWTLVSGSLPAGLTLSPAGVISGTPTTASSVPFAFTARVADSSTPIPQTATQQFSLTVGARATTTSVGFGANPAVVGQAVPVTVTVSDTQGSGTASSPAGTVTVSGDPGLSAGSCALAPSATVGVSTCLVTETAASPGSRTISASYPASTVHQLSGGSNMLNVNQAATTASAVSSVNPSVFGQPVTITATVSAAAPGAGTPTGTVTFSDGATTLGTATLSGATATFTTSGLGAGAHPITASYGGDLNFKSSASAVLAQVVNAAPTQTTLVSATNPSVFGQAVLLTANVAVVAPGVGTPTGTVTFSDGATPIGTAPLSGGQATLTASAFGAGTHALTASFGASGSFAASVSGTVSQVVSKAGTANTLVSSLNPSVFGQAVTFTAAVGSTPAGTSGTVTFTDAGAPIGSAALVGGVASFTTSALAIGSHPIAAIYGGDDNFSLSTSATLTQVVKASPYTFTGFGSPLVTAGTLSSPTFSGNANLGNAIPIKWQLFDSSGNNVTDLASTTVLKAVLNTTCSGAATGPETLLYAPTVGATGGSTFRSSSSGFIFNWDTTSVVPTGPACYTLVLQLNDGSVPRATTVRLQ